jgi:hypothetical protein
MEPAHPGCRCSGSIVGYSTACPAGTTKTEKLCPFGQIVSYSVACPTSPPAPPPPPPPPIACPDGSTVPAGSQCPPPAPPPIPTQSCWDGSEVPLGAACPPKPIVWTLCAPEGGNCALNGPANVRYGANGIYKTKAIGANASGAFSIGCRNDQWGGDPLPNVVKHCDTDGTLAPPPVPKPPIDCGQGVFVPAGQACPPPPPPPAPPPGPKGQFAIGQSVHGLNVCASLMNPVDGTQIGASYSIVGFAGLEPQGGAGDAFGPPAGTQEIVILNDGSHHGDGWSGIFVPAGCIG